MLKKRKKIYDTNLGKKLIIETNREDGRKIIIDAKPTRFWSNDLINESVGNGHTNESGDLFLVGRLQSFDVENQNGRIYKEELLRREIDRYQQLITEKRAWGECDHPESGVIEFGNVSHLVLKAWWEGNHLMGKVVILNTPAGKILKEIYRWGPIGMSSRGLGTVTETGGQVIVNEDYQLLCFDAVTEPSTPGAFVNKRVMESKMPQTKEKVSDLDSLFDYILK